MFSSQGGPGGGKWLQLVRLLFLILGHVTLNEAPSTIPHRGKSRRYFSFGLNCTLLFNKKIYGLFSNCAVSVNPAVSSNGFDLLPASRAYYLEPLHFHSTISPRAVKLSISLTSRNRRHRDIYNIIIPCEQRPAGLLRKGS